MTQLVFLDTETTGLSRDDRIVSLAAIAIDSQALREPEWDAFARHLVFNPGRPSHPRAAAVHGYSDQQLSWQDSFLDHADTIQGLLTSDAIVVAHNASFDRRFVEREFASAGKPIVLKTTCTMRAWRARHPDGSASLKAILPQLGLRRSAETHGALEDAWLAMQVFRYLEGLQPTRGGLPWDDRPQNWRDAPRPENVRPPTTTCYLLLSWRTWRRRTYRVQSQQRCRRL